LICIDEAGFYVGDHSRRGYAPRGSRLHVGASRTLRRRKLTLLLAISKRGLVHFKILDHNCKKEDFVDFIQTLPVAPGSTLLMDNVAFHHSNVTVAAVHSKGCHTLYTLPYSPCLNAIEYAFSSIKTRYRRSCPAGGHFAGGFDYAAALCRVLKEPHDMVPYFRHVARTVIAATARRGIDFKGYDHHRVATSNDGIVSVGI
jgi:transposase